MPEYLPLLIVGAIIGLFTLGFSIAFLLEKDKKKSMGFERNMKDSEIVRRLLRYAKPYLGQFILVFFVMLFSIVYDVLSPMLIGRIEEMVKADFVLSKLFSMVAVYAGILVVSLICTYAQAMLLQKVGQKILSQIRMDVFTHIESLSHEQLNNIPVGKLVTRVSNDPNAISFMFTNVLITLLKNAMVIIGVLAAMLVLNYALTLMVLCFVPFVVLFTVIFRKFSRKAFTAEDFIRFGTWTEQAAEFMRLCVRLRKNVIVAGGTGSGKTTLLNLLSGFIPHTERIITVEDAAELRLQQPHVVRLEARPPNIEGKGAVTIRDLVKNCLRMRPDRIIVGECRGGEALDMLQAMNTGHDGSLTTVHANSPRDVVSRLETMVLMSGMDLPSRAIREQIASAVDIIIHESRMSDGSRKVDAITEVTGLEGTQIVMQDLFTFVQSGVGADGKVIGEFKSTGAVPTWIDQARSRGIDVDMSMFAGE